MGQLQTIHEELTDLGYRVIAISPDKPERVGAAAAKKRYDYTLLSDNDLQAALALGLAFKVDEETVKRYKNFGIDLVEASGREHHLLPVPAVFIVNKKGEIRFSFVDPVYQRRIDPATLLAAAKYSLK